MVFFHRREQMREFLSNAFLDVGNEQRVEVDCGDVIDGLLDESSAECIGTSDLQHVTPAFQHFGNKLISG